MVTLNTAENALKNVYLDVLSEQIKISSNPFYSRIKTTTSDIFGKEVVKVAPFGLSGGFGAGGETDPLPISGNKNYAQLRSTLKNLYGTFEISDKAVRASANNIANFVDLLSDEMEALVKSCVFNLNRMLYGTNKGVIATVKSVDSTSGAVTCDSVSAIMEGMYVDAYATSGKKNTVPFLIKTVDRVNKTFTYDKGANTAAIAASDEICVQNSRGNELTGLNSIFSTDNIYGLNRSDYLWLKPFSKNVSGEISDIAIQEVIDYLEEYADSKVNFITTSSTVRRAYQQYLNIYRKNVDVVEIENGFKAITHNGIPVYADKFVEDGSLYLLNTDDFTMHTLGDWQWMQDEGGHVLRQNPGFPTYTGTIAKYAELICNKPMGQGKLTGITSSVNDPYKTYIPEANA